MQVALDAVQSKIRPLNQSIAILKDEENEMKEQAKKVTITPVCPIMFRNSRPCPTAIS